MYTELLNCYFQVCFGEFLYIYIYLYLYTIQCISIAMEAIWSHGPFKDDQHDGLPIKIVIFHGHVELPDSILCTYSNRQKDRRD